MEKEKKKFFSARNIAILAVLVALVVVLQLFGLAIPMGGTTSMSFVLVPIVLGGALLGPVAGAILGAVFGIVTIFDPMAQTLINYAPAVTVLTVLLKGTLAGVVSSLVYRLIAKKNKYVAVFVAAALAPITNTGIFVIGVFCMKDAVLAYLAGFPFETFMLSVILVNFAIELAVNIILAPAIYTVENVVEKQILNKRNSKNRNSDKEAVEVKDDNLS